MAVCCWGAQFFCLPATLQKICCILVYAEVGATSTASGRLEVTRLQYSTEYPSLTCLSVGEYLCLRRISSSRPFFYETYLVFPVNLCLHK